GGGKEGEGAPKGEGEGGEGEGAAAEGEGGGEGEGGAGEGEGAGGEGEGGGPPVCANPDCGFLQECVSNGVCQDDAGTSLCDNFVIAGTADFFADQSLVLDGVAGDRYSIDDGSGLTPPGDRFYRHRTLVVRQNMTIRV